MDIFAPCALGAIINDNTLSRLTCKIIAGSANNQLAKEDVHGMHVLQKGILYAPDYVINAGELINVYNEFSGYDRARAMHQAEGIYSILKNIFRRSKEENIPKNIASAELAEERINSIKHLSNMYIGTFHFAGRFGEIAGQGPW